MKSVPSLFVLATMCASVLSAQEMPAPELLLDIPAVPSAPMPLPSDEGAQLALLPAIVPEDQAMPVMPVPEPVAVPIEMPATPAPVLTVPAADTEEEKAKRKFNDAVNFAESLFRRKMYDLAAEEFEPLLKQTSEEELLFIDLSLRLAECYAKTDRFDEAKKLYNQVSSSAIEGDHRATARLRLASIYREMGDNEMALPFLETVVDDKKCAADLCRAARIELAQLLVTMKRYDAAIVQYKALAATSSAHEVSAKIALIRIYNDMQDYIAALDLCTEVLQHKSATPAEQQDVAAFGFSVACQQQDLPRAVTFVKNQNKAAFPRLNVAWVLLKTGDAEEASSWLADDKAANPTASAERLSLESSICEALKDPAGAVTACERLLAEFPEAPECKAAAATMLVIRARQGQPTPFLQAYERVKDLLSEETKVALAPYRLDAALRTKDVVAARAAAALLEAKGTPEQASDALYRIAWMAQEDANWLSAGEDYLTVATKWPMSSVAGRAAYAAAYAFSRAGMNDRQALAIQTALNTKDEAIIPDVLMLRARMELAEKNYAAASRTLDEYLIRFATAKDAPEANYLRGLLFFRERDFVPAEAALKLACELGQEANTSCRPLSHERRIDAMVRRAQALHALSRSDEAAALLQPIIEMKDAEKLDPTYLYWLAEFRLGRKEWAMAEHAARLMVARTAPGSVHRMNAHVLDGRAHEGLGNNDSALVAYLAALEMKLSPPTTKTIEAALGAGRMYRLSGEYQKACDCFVGVTKMADQETATGRAALAEAFSGIAATCKALKQEHEALRANMRLIIFFDKDNPYVPQAYRDAIEMLETKGAKDKEKAKILREEYEAKYNQKL